MSDLQSVIYLDWETSSEEVQELVTSWEFPAELRRRTGVGVSAPWLISGVKSPRIQEAYDWFIPSDPSVTAFLWVHSLGSWEPLRRGDVIQEDGEGQFIILQ